MLLFVLAQAAAAAVAPPAAPAPATPLPVAATAPSAQEGVTSYGADFFAAYRPNNALEMVQRLPGFTLDTGSGVRGYDAAAGNVLIDGQRPATKADTLDQSLYRIPAGAVDHIEVIRGGAPGIDMQGKTVIANVVRKSGGGFHGLLAAAGYQLNDGRGYWAVRAEGSGKIGERSWEGGLLAGNNADNGFGRGPTVLTDGHGKLLENGRLHAQGEGTNETANGALEQPLWGGRLRVNARLSGQAYDSNETDTFGAPDVHTTTEHQDDGTFSSEFGARYIHALGARASLETVLLRQDHSERYVDNFQAPGDVEIFHLDDTTAETIGRAVATFQQSRALSWEGGGEVAYNTLTSQTRFSDNGAAVALPAANVTVEEKRAEIFGKAVWKVTPSITLEGAVREEGSRISSSGDVVLEKTLYYTKPRVLVTWSPDADTQLRFRVERVVGQLDFGAFVASTSSNTNTVSVGNPNLVPEQDWVFEGAAERSFWTRGSVVLTLRHSQITDVVDRAPVFGAGGSVFDAPANIGAGSKDEESIAVTLPLDRLGLKGAQISALSTWRQSEVTDPTTHAQREITGLHPIDWEIHFTHDLPAWKLNYGVDFYGEERERYFRFNQVDTRKYGAGLNPFVEYKPRPDIAWRFEFDNALARSFKRSVDEYNGVRGSGPPDAVLNRQVYTPQVAWIRLRKLFGT